MIWLLGFLTPILPLVWPFGLTCLTIFIGLRSPKKLCSALKWAPEYLLVIFSWCLSYLYFQVDWKNIDLLSWQHFVAVNPTYYSACKQLLIYVSIPVLFTTLRESRGEQDGFVNGLSCGLLLCVILGLLEIFFDFRSYFPNQTTFWSELGRYSASFSDPNACGIFMALVMPLIIEAKELRKVSKVALLTGTSVLAVWSGSRSFMLALGIYAIFYLWSRWRTKILVPVLLIMLAAVTTASFYSPVPGQLPIGLQRLWSSLDYHNLPQTIYSRLAFWKIGWAIFLDNFALGVGFQSFPNSVFRYARVLNLPLGTWSDNSNNFYLGVLAETGILGAMALAIACSRLKINPESSACAKASLIALLLLLLIGPHLYFPEVAILAALIMSKTLEVRIFPEQTKSNFFSLASIFILVATPIFVKSNFLERGLYLPEEAPPGTYFRWAAKQSQILLTCNKGNARLALKAANPDIAQQPLQVTITANGRSQTLNLNHSAEELQIIDCIDSGNLLTSVEVSHVWVPLRFGVGKDPRILGIQLRDLNLS